MGDRTAVTQAKRLSAHRGSFPGQMPGRGSSEGVSTRGRRSDLSRTPGLSGHDPQEEGCDHLAHHNRLGSGTCCCRARRRGGSRRLPFPCLRHQLLQRAQRAHAAGGTTHGTGSAGGNLRGLPIGSPLNQCGGADLDPEADLDAMESMFPSPRARTAKLSPERVSASWRQPPRDRPVRSIAASRPVRTAIHASGSRTKSRTAAPVSERSASIRYRASAALFSAERADRADGGHVVSGPGRAGGVRRRFRRRGPGRRTGPAR